MINNLVCITYLTKWLQEVGAGDWNHDVYVVNDEQRLVLHLVGEVGHVVCQVQHLRQTGFLQHTDVTFNK